ncbi:hypothetical protein HAX54_001439, partial [Datura stramonium]|nr:hypothetical protein [Datura stramonium]
ILSSQVSMKNHFISLSLLNVLMAEEASPSTQGELPSAASRTVPGSLPKLAPSTLALFLEFACSDKCCPSGMV